MKKSRTESQPKYTQIKDMIKGQVLNGQYPTGGRLPTCRELALEFEVSYVTVTNAVKELEKEGYIYSKQGKGMFVKSPDHFGSEVGDRRGSQAGFLVHTQGDIFQNYFSTVIRELDRLQMMAVPLLPTFFLSRIDAEEENRLICRYASAGFDTLVIDGNRHFPFRALESWQHLLRQIIFVFNYAAEIEFPKANVIVYDNRQVGYLAASHMLGKGIRRLAVLSFQEQHEIERRGKGSELRTYDLEILDGIQKAFDEFGVNFHTGCKLARSEYKTDEITGYDDFLQTFLSAGRCGVFTVGDYRARAVYRNAERLGLKIGHDVDVIGMYNTSWTESLSPTLSSVSINEETIAGLTVKAIEENWQGRRIVVDPTLVLRQSS